MNVKLLGLGAVGAPLAVKLVEVCDFSIIVDDKRKIRYKEKGQYINHVRYDFSIADEEDPKTDVIILSCKNFHLDKAIEEIKPYVDKNTIILPILNGVTSEKKLINAFSKENVLYGFIVNISANHSDNNTFCYNDSWKIYFSSENNEVDERVLKVKKLFEKAKVNYIIPKDIHHEIWWKFMLNTCFNSLSAALLLTYSDMQNNENLISMVKMVSAEVRLIAKMEGINLSDDDEERMINTILSLNDEGKTSMLQDLEAKRESENSFFSLAVSNLGKTHNIKTPYCDFIYHLVEAKAKSIK